MEIEKLYDLYRASGGRVSTDTRYISPGEIYVALKGENFDGNSFATDALAKGASYAIIDNPTYATDERCVLVENTLRALQDLGHYHRMQFAIPVLAIGGSNGKTTTKELIAAVLSKKYRVHTTTGNLNNDIGVPLTLLAMNKDSEIGIIEIGANHPGEHLTLLDILNPTHVVITNNGADHLEGFGSLAGVRAANKEIYDWTHTHTAHAFVNKDIQDLVQDSADLDRTLYPTSRSQSHSSLCAGILYKDIEFSSSLFGAYNEPNIDAAIAVGEYFDVPLSEIQEAIAAYAPSLKRSQIIKKDDYSIVLDCYNANPSSMELALKDFFAHTEAGNRIVIIGDMLEMGSVEKEVHTNTLNLVPELADDSDTIICVGPRFGISKDAYPFHFYQDSGAARQYFNTLDLTGKTVFLKASRGIKLEDVIKEKIPL